MLTMQSAVLISKQRLLDRLSQKYVKPSHTVSTLAIITKDRPYSALASLKSFIRNHRYNRRDIDYLICDDSRSRTNIVLLKAGIRRIKDELGVKVYYAGNSEKDAYAMGLARQSGIRKSLIAFALRDVYKHGNSAGANRNSALLHCIGQFMAMTDDDIMCRTISSPVHLSDMYIALHGSMACLRFYDTRRNLFGSLKCSYEYDVLSLHEMNLGQYVGALSQRIGPTHVHCHSLDNSRVKFFLNSGPRIFATGCGVAGDSGIRPFTFYLTQQGGRRDELLKSEEFYLKASRNRQVLMMPSMLSVSRGPWKAGYSAYDHTRLVPPFVPVGHDEDGIFGRIVRLCLRDAWQCRLPYAVTHIPAERRYFTNTRIWESLCTLHNELLHLILQAFEQRRSLIDDKTDDQRMIEVGNHLLWVGSLPIAKFREIATTALWTFNSLRRKLLQDLLNEHNESPFYWARDVRIAIKHIESMLGKVDAIAPYDLRGCRSVDEVWKTSQKLIRRFGELLTVWPRISEAAKDLGDLGVRLGKEIE